MSDSCAPWYLRRVIWFFERNQQRLQIETTHDRVGRTFQLTIMDSDGTPQVESFKSKKAFETRLRQLEAELIADAWTPSGSALLPRSPASLH
jgi:hypothetical protein